MKDLEHARRMLAIAEKDLTAIKAMEDAQTFSDEIFGFHAQQAVEKALKAWLSLAGVKYPRIHDLEELFALVKDAGQSVPETFPDLKSLTDFAVHLRYEVVEDLGEKLERDRTIGKVDELIGHVINLLEK